MKLSNVSLASVKLVDDISKCQVSQIKSSTILGAEMTNYKYAHSNSIPWWPTLYLSLSMIATHYVIHWPAFIARQSHKKS